MTQEQLAEKSGLPQTTIADWERSGLPGREEILRLARALGVSVAQVLRAEKSPQRDAAKSKSATKINRNT